MDANKKGNSIIEYLKTIDPEMMERVISTFATCRKLDFMSIKQGDIVMLTPDQAFEYKGNEGDKYFKIWMAGDKIAWCTWANSMIDSHFRWNSKESNPEKKRDNTDILGNEPYVSQFIKSTAARKKCSIVYMFPFEAFSSTTPTKVKPKMEEKPTGAAEPAVDKKVREKSNEQKVDKLLDDLSELSTSIARSIEHGWSCNDDIVEFQNKLMQLKILVPANAMVQYYEEMSKTWKPQKKRKGLIESAFDLLFG